MLTFKGKLGEHGGELVRNALLAGGTRAFGVLLSFALLWLVGQRFGEEGAGLFTVPQSVLIILRIVVSMGLGLAMVRLISQLPSAGEIWPRYVAAARAMSIAAILAGAILLCFARSSGLIIVGIALPFFALSQLHAEVARGLKRMVASEIFRGVGIPLIALILFGLCLGATAEGAFLSYAIGCGAVAAISFGFVILTLRSKRVDGAKVETRQLLALSMPMMIGEFGVILLGRIDHIMLEILGTTADAGVYGVVLRLSAIVLFLPGAIGAIAAPKIAGVFWKEADGFPNLARLVAKMMFWTALIPAIVLGVAPGFWMGIFGDGFERGWLALLGLALAGVIVASTGFIGSILNMTGGEKFYRNIILIAVATNIVLNLILIPPFKLNGAALASLITVVGWNAAAVGYVWRKHGFLLLHIPFFRRRKKR